MASHATVLGAGLMGRLLACALAERGHAVEVFDAGGADGSGSAARVAAAMLAPLAESAVTEPVVVRLGAHSIERWPALIAALPAPVFFQRTGTLVLWHRQDAPEAERLRAQFARTARAVPELPHAQALDAAGVERLEPALGRRFVQGFFLPDEGQLDNRALLAALLARMAGLGVRVHWNRACAPDDVDVGTAGWLFDCRGLGARPEWPALRGVRGEVARVHAPEVRLSRPTRLLHPRYPLYIAPKPDGLFVIGATEIESDDLSPASVRSTLELLSAAYSVHPGFAEARIVELATQLRPTLPDNLPALRWLGPRRLQINGLYRHGFLVAPAMLDAALELMEDGRSALAERVGLAVESASAAGAARDKPAAGPANLVTFASDAANG
ncbi:FAD-dependent oxidoreductase [Piscinibacter koreensis]|uniref:D-amino-acid oxidase n=1 Tax=Piscinibacter koreensis TaxID=2742824 RepID=A0A7Y6NKG5_9BURK|nr:FAD-dependent oxidoreductase [Schlegelella koreensis]NUZ04764.1 FAD-dependent oxidoreductase [Schlegelella koreensis]